MYNELIKKSIHEILYSMQFKFIINTQLKRNKTKNEYTVSHAIYNKTDSQKKKNIKLISITCEMLSHMQFRTKTIF